MRGEGLEEFRALGAVFIVCRKRSCSVGESLKPAHLWLSSPRPWMSGQGVWIPSGCRVKLLGGSSAGRHVLA